MASQLTSDSERSESLYSIGTWDVEEQAYLPHPGMRCINISRKQLVLVMRHLRKCGYTCHRYGNTRTDDRDSDTAVVIERTDGKPRKDILEGWKR
jgi:hypothetical protein